jgi:hypothetical protein
MDELVDVKQWSFYIVEHHSSFSRRARKAPAGAHAGQCWCSVLVLGARADLVSRSHEDHEDHEDT